MKEEKGKTVRIGEISHEEIKSHKTMKGRNFENCVGIVHDPVEKKYVRVYFATNHYGRKNLHGNRFLSVRCIDQGIRLFGDKTQKSFVGQKSECTC